jgi:hypothetical protein
LVSNSSGLIASGSPDKQVHVWDARGKNKIQTLIGHMDIIRDLLMSDDGKWLISASSDSTIKLWSIAMPSRCITTYTHSMDSIWCVASNSPTLDTFWSGGRDGWVFKISNARAEHECVAICKEDAPVLDIVGLDNLFIYTATTNTGINCWGDVLVGPECANLDCEKILYIPSSSIVRDSFDDDQDIFNYAALGKDMSISSPVLLQLKDSIFGSSEASVNIEPVFSTPLNTIAGLKFLF